MSQYPNQSGEYPGQPQQGQQGYTQYPQQGYPQQPYYPPQQPMPPMQPPRKKSNLLLIFGIIGGILLVSCIGCGIISAANSNKNSGSLVAETTRKTQDNQQNAAPAPASNPHFKVGDVVKVSDTFQITLNTVKTNQGDDFNQPTKAGDTFVQVDITIKNVSSSEKNISSLLQFHLNDSDGQRYTEKIMTNATPPDGKLEAGDVLKGTLSYEVPASKHQYVFAFEPSLVQSGQTQWDVTI